MGDKTVSDVEMEKLIEIYTGLDETKRSIAVLGLNLLFASQEAEKMSVEEESCTTVHS